MAACAMPGWAALSAGGIRALMLPPEATHIIICADHDASGVGQRAADDAAARWLAEGRRVRVALPPEPDTDFADMLDTESGMRGECSMARENVRKVIDLAPDIKLEPPRPTEPAADRGTEGTPRSLISQRASDVVPERINWLWPGRIAVGKLTLIGGQPGFGKSQLTMAVAACVSNGSAWPCNEGHAPCGAIVLLSAEDGVKDTIVPRLIAAGADMANVFIVTGVTNARGRKTFDLKADVDLLEAKVREIGNVRLIVIDPISAYMGGADGHNNVEIRGVLEPISEMADRLRVAVVAVTHFNKRGVSNQGVLERFIGSIAFIAAARAAFAVIPDDEIEGRALFLQVKNNIAPPQKGLAFRRRETFVSDGITSSKIDWDPEYVDQSADEALSAAEVNSTTVTAKAQAIEFLRTVLADGPMFVKKIEEQAIEAGLLVCGDAIAQDKPIREARKALGVVPKKDGFGSAGWLWSLPADALMPSNRIDAHSQDRASMDAEGTYGVVAPFPTSLADEEMII
jgi:putative DNA primase/helicase